MSRKRGEKSQTLLQDYSVLPKCTNTGVVQWPCLCYHLKSMQFREIRIVLRSRVAIVIQGTYQKPKKKKILLSSVKIAIKINIWPREENQTFIEAAVGDIP